MGMRSTTSPRGNYGVELFLEADGRDAGEEGPVARRVARLSCAVPGDETPSRGVGRALRRAMPPNFGAPRHRRASNAARRRGKRASSSARPAAKRVPRKSARPTGHRSSPIRYNRQNVRYDMRKARQK